MSLAGVKQIALTPIECQLLWKCMHQYRDKLLEPAMLELEERIRGGHDGVHAQAWHVLDTERVQLSELMMRLMAEGKPPTIVDA